MAQNTYKSNMFKKPEKEKKGKSSKSKFKFDFLKDPRLKLAAGFFLQVVDERPAQPIPVKHHDER